MADTNDGPRRRILRGVFVLDFDSLKPRIDEAAIQAELATAAAIGQTFGPSQLADLRRRHTRMQGVTRGPLLSGQEALLEQFMTPKMLKSLQETGSVSGVWNPAGVDDEAPWQTKQRVEAWIAQHGMPTATPEPEAGQHVEYEPVGRGVWHGLES